MDYAYIAGMLAAEGFLARGGFLCRSGDGVPPLPGGETARTLIMVGNVGSGEFWQGFKSSSEFSDGEPHPMDRWTARVLGVLASELGGLAVFPFGGKPYHPFQRWASRAEQLFQSPLGLSIHPEYGLWHAYRGALLFTEEVADLPPKEISAHPCENCPDRPCLTACPVGAFWGEGYDALGCARHIASHEGRDCLGAGCLARRACPVGRDYLTVPSHAAFHMRAFLRARQDAGEFS